MKRIQSKIKVSLRVWTTCAQFLMQMMFLTSFFLTKHTVRLFLSHICTPPAMPKIQETQHLSYNNDSKVVRFFENLFQYKLRMKSKVLNLCI